MRSIMNTCLITFFGYSVMKKWAYLYKFIYLLFRQTCGLHNL